jgi:hypothetical protein
MNTKTIGIMVVATAMLASAVAAILPALTDDAFASRVVNRDNGRGGDGGDGAIGGVFSGRDTNADDIEDNNNAGGGGGGGGGGCAGDDACSAEDD